MSYRSHLEHCLFVYQGRSDTDSDAKRSDSSLDTTKGSDLDATERSYSKLDTYDVSTRYMANAPGKASQFLDCFFQTRVMRHFLLLVAGCCDKDPLLRCGKQDLHLLPITENAPPQQKPEESRPDTWLKLANFQDMMVYYITKLNVHSLSVTCIAGSTLPSFGKYIKTFCMLKH